MRSIEVSPGAIRAWVSAASSSSILAGTAVGFAGLERAVVDEELNAAFRLAARASRLAASWAAKPSFDAPGADITLDLEESWLSASETGLEGVAGCGGALAPISGTEWEGAEGKGLESDNGAVCGGGKLVDWSTCPNWSIGAA